MKYSEQDKKEIWNSIIAELVSGRSMRSILRDSGMPSLKTIYAWIDKDESKRKQYARACEVRADLIFDEIMDISNSTDEDIINLDNGKQAINHHVIMRDRLRVDSRKWMLSKMNPKKYGDRLDIDHGGKLDVEVTLTPEQREKRIQELKEKLNDN